MATIQPAQKTLLYSVVPSSGSAIVNIDIAKDLSMVNRRMYRQGMQYAVAGVSVSRATIDGGVTHCILYTAGNTWVVQNAWKKAQAHWLQQQRRARKLIGQSAKPAYEDFKVFLDDASRTGTTIAPIAGDGGAVGAGEWDYSVLHVEAEDHSISEWYMHLIGGDIGATDRGLILGYQESRATVQATDPELPAAYGDNMYANMADDLDDVARDVAADMEDENDAPPYDQDDYPGNDTNSDVPWVQESAAANAGAPNAVLGGFVAECGLVRFNLQGFTSAGADTAAPNVSVMVTLIPGKYKGIMAKPMGQ